jgi:hypothetical protein
MQDQDAQDSQDNPEAAQKTQNAANLNPGSASSLWNNLKIAWLFATNTPHKAMQDSNYPGPCIETAAPPEAYAKGSDSEDPLLEYLDEFPKKW